MVYSARRFVVCLTLCHFVLVFFSPFSIAITSLGEERVNLSAFRTVDRFVFVWICRFPLPLGVWEGLRFVIVALAGLLSYLLYTLLFYIYVVVLFYIFTPVNYEQYYSLLFLRFSEHEIFILKNSVVL